MSVRGRNCKKPRGFFLTYIAPSRLLPFPLQGSHWPGGSHDTGNQNRKVSGARKLNQKHIFRKRRTVGMITHPREQKVVNLDRNRGCAENYPWTLQPSIGYPFYTWEMFINLSLCRYVTKPANCSSKSPDLKGK